MARWIRTLGVASVVVAAALAIPPAVGITKVFDRQFPLPQFCPLESRGSSLANLEFQPLGPAARITFSVKNLRGTCDGFGGKPCSDRCDCNTAPCDPSDETLPHFCQKFCFSDQVTFCDDDAQCVGSACGAWNRLVLDNVTVVRKNDLFLQHLTGPVPGYDGEFGCYQTNEPYPGAGGGQNDAPAYNFNAPGTPENFLDLFDTASDVLPRGWTGQVYWDSVRVAPRVPGALVEADLDLTGGSLGVGDPNNGSGTVSASFVVTGLDPNQPYVVFAWWSIELPDKMTVTINPNVCIDADGDGFAACVGGCDPDGLTCGDCDDTKPHCRATCVDADADGWCTDNDCNDNVTTCTTNCVTDLDADTTPDCRDTCVDADGDRWGAAGGAGNSCLGPDCDDARPACNVSCTDTDGDTIGDACDTCTDTDHDGYGNPGFAFSTCPLDNCPTAANANQANTDADSFGDACDVCPALTNPFQEDTDGDRDGDLCDNCPSIYNPAQDGGLKVLESAAGGHEMVLSPEPRFTPDGSYLVHSTRRFLGGSWHADLWGGPVGPTTVPYPLTAALPNAGEIKDYSLASYPYVVVRRGDAPYYGLYVTRLDQPGPYVLLAGDPTPGQTSNATSQTVTPDGSTILFGARLSSASPYVLYKSPLWPGAPAAITGAPTGLTGIPSVGVTPDGTRVLHTADPNSPGIFRLYSTPIGGGTPAAVGNGNVLSWKVSSDSARVVYSIDVGGGSWLFSAPVSGGTGTLLFSGPNPSSRLETFDSFWLTPDGQRVVFVADQTNPTQYELYSIPIAGGTASKLSPALVPAGDVDVTVTPEITPDGQTVIYRADATTDTRYSLYASPVAGGTPVQIFPVGPGTVDTFAISPNGSLVVLVGNGAQLYSVPVSGGSPLILQNASPTMRPRFSADGAQVIYTGPTGPWLYLYSQSPTVSLTRVLINDALFSGGQVPFGAISPDLKRVAYVADDASLGRQLFTKILVADTDTDSALNLCDCAAQDPGVFAIPNEIRDLVATSPGSSEFSFGNAYGGTATGFDIVWGDLTMLPVGPGGGDELGLCGVAGLTYSLTNDPAPGHGYWLMVRGHNSCGAGTFGYQEDVAPFVTERITSTCP